MTNPLIADRDAFAARHPEQTVTLNGRSWGVVNLGAGPALLLLPGTLGRADIFWNQMAALSGQMRIIAVSYPATGGITAWAEDLDQLLQDRGITQAAVVGSSLGGYVAQWFASAYPARVSHLFAANTLCETDILATQPPYALDLDTLPITLLQQGFTAKLEEWRSAHPDQSDLVDLLLTEVSGRIPEDQMRMRLKALKEAPALPPSDRAPDSVTTIESDDDPLIPPPLRAAVRGRLTPGVAHHFPQAGHFPYISRAADYTALLQQILGPDAA